MMDGPTDQSLDGPAVGLGLATIAGRDRILDTWYPWLSLDPQLAAAFNGPGSAGSTVPLGHATAVPDALQDHVDRLHAAAAAEPPPTGTRRVAVATRLDSLADPPRDPHEVFLRLHLLSTRTVRPNQVSLEGVFDVLHNVVWTDLGPCDPNGFDDLRLELTSRGIRLLVRGVDKFPAMTDYVIPAGVRIADTTRVRLGAHLAAGTTLMHEGFCNFNAGTLGPAMIEGRISAGVVIGAGSDLGGSASVMGTLSGGGRETIRIGRGCLVGANAGVGISLGDGCVIEAGLYVTAGSRVLLADGTVVKARALSGRPGLLYRRNSQTGAIEAHERDADWGALNDSLHANQ